MSRVFRQSNAFQAIREVFQVTMVLPAGVLVIMAHKATVEESTSSTMFLIAVAVMWSILSRELGWLMRFMLWMRRKRLPPVPLLPIKASPEIFFAYAFINAILAVAAFAPLVYNYVSEVSGRWARINSSIEPIAFAGVVSIITGDLIGAGLLAGLERWGTLNGQNFSWLPGSVITVLFIPTAILCILHAGRTILALVGYDPLYLHFLIDVRWEWDAHSEAAARDGGSCTILASTSNARPFFQRTDEHDGALRTRNTEKRSEPRSADVEKGYAD